MSAVQVELDEFRAQLEELLEKAARGEEIVITRNQKPIVRVLSWTAARRPFGSAKGLV